MTATPSSHVCLRDLLANTTTLVSRASGADGAKGNSRSEHASVSAHARVVAFDSTATHPSPDDSDGGLAVYVRVLVTNTHDARQPDDGRPA